MIKKAFDFFSFKHLEDVKEVRQDINKRINKLEATLDGESRWMLEKIDRPKKPKKPRCNCEET